MTIDKGIVIKNIYYMLAYAFAQLRASYYKEIEAEEFEEIYDLFAEILSRGIAYVVKQGLHKEYVEIDESLPTLRGRIDISQTISNMVNRRQRMHCTYDVLLEDNIYNQILKTAVVLLLHQDTVKDSRKAALRKVMLFFRDVATLDPGEIKWSRLRYDRNSKTYQMLHYLCYFIIDSKLLSTEKGKYKMRQFSDEHMNLLFEHFVLEYYRRHHPECKANAKQLAWNIDRSISSVDQLPILQTDIFLTLGDRTLIIDTKYYSKSLAVHFDKHTIHSGNLYQMHAYVTNHDVAHRGNVDGMLLYAKTEEDITPDGQMVLNDGNIIKFRTLDLNQPFAGIKNQLETLIQNQ